MSRFTSSALVGPSDGDLPNEAEAPVDDGWRFYEVNATLLVKNGEKNGKLTNIS